MVVGAWSMAEALRQLFEIIIVVCYSDVLNEFSATNTYVHNKKECEQLCLEHIWYMADNRFEVKH